MPKISQEDSSRGTGRNTTPKAITVTETSPK